MNVWSNPIAEELKKIESYVYYVNPYYSLVYIDLIKRIKKHNIKIFPWIINDRETVQNFKNLNVDGIVTNYPDLLHEKKGS